MRTFLASLLLATLAAAEEPKPEDWPRFRGPRGDGRSTETGLLTAWSQGGPEVLWKVRLGGGFSGISAVDGRLFTLFSRDGDEILAAFDAATGRRVWELRVDRERSDQFGSGPRSTPTVDRGLVFAAGALGQLVAVRAASGEEVWRRDLIQDFEAKVPTWGIAASPIVEGDLVLFNAGGPERAVVALRRQDGSVVWTAEDDLQAGYSTPLAIRVDRLRLVVFFSGTQVFALRPDDGETLWKRPWKTAYNVNAATPVFVPPNKLLVSSGYGTGAALFHLEARGGELLVREMWTSRDLKNQFSSSVYHEGHIYGFDNKNLRCLDARNADTRWRKSGFGHGALLYADGHLIVLGDTGRLALVEATPAAYTEKASAAILTGKHWTVPALYGGRLFLRNEREMVCVKVAG